MVRLRHGIARLRDPDYTGRNRCLPCTAINVFFAFAASVAVNVVVILTGTGGGPALVLSEGLFLFGVAIMYVRGYLVPGTPALNARYLPSWLLDALGKGTPPAGFTGADAAGRLPTGDVGVLSTLSRVGALERVSGSDDRVVTSEFQRLVREELDEHGDRPRDERGVLDLLGRTTGDVRFEEYGKEFRAFCDGALVGSWESRLAFRTDVGVGAVLRDRLDEWNEVEGERRGQLLGALRRRLRTCPDCGSELSADASAVETCCSTYDVTTVACETCRTRIFESRIAR